MGLGKTGVEENTFFQKTEKKSAGIHMFFVVFVKSKPTGRWRNEMCEIKTLNKSQALLMKDLGFRGHGSRLGVRV